MFAVRLANSKSITISDDHRRRLWYTAPKTAWEQNSSLTTGWSSIYEFATARTIGVTVVGVAAHSSSFLGVMAVDFELGSLSRMLNTSLLHTDATWAYIVERSNGRLLGVTSNDVLYDKDADGSFLDQRLSATASQHPSVAASAQVLASRGWPAIFHQNLTAAR